MEKRKKNKWKIFGSYALFIAVGAGVGFLIGKFGLAEGLKGMSLWEVLAKLLVGYLFFMLAVLVQIVFHEAGHMLAALSRGWKFLSFMILGVVLSRREGRFHLSRFRVSGAGGQCLMLPPEQGETDWGIVLYNMGGVLANLLLTVASAVPLLVCYDALSWAAALFLAVMALTGMFLVLVNGIPNGLAGIPNDGMNILKLHGDSFSSDVFLNSLRVVGYLQTDNQQRLAEMPYLCEGKKLEPKNAIHMMALSVDLSLAMSRMDFGKARDLLKSVEPYWQEMAPIFRHEMTFERIFLALAVFHEESAVARLLDDAFLRYLRQQAAFRPSALRVQYLLARLHEKDEVKAEQLYQRFRKVCRTYHIRGEATIEQRLVEYIREVPAA